MFFMILFILGVDQDIIYEYHNKLVQKLHEYLVHHTHEVCRGIGQTKRHDCILIKSISGGVSGLGYILFSNLQLVVPRSKIALGENTSSFQLIKQIIDHWSWILVLDGHLIQ